MKRPKLAVLPYRHHPQYKYVVDLRPFGRGRKFFKTRAEAEAERMRQKTALERHGREAIDLPQHELSDFIRARKKLADYDKTINDATTFYVDHLERVRRCKTTVAQLAAEVIEAKRRDGMSGARILQISENASRTSAAISATAPLQVSPSRNSTIGCATYRSRQKAARTIGRTLACCSVTQHAAG